MANPKKPTKLALIDGNPGKRPINKEEPDWRLADLKPPRGMKGEALRMWKELAPELDRLGMLNVASRRALISACDMYAAKVQAHKEGQMAQYVKLDTAFRMWCKEFGFTPSSQAGIRAPGKKHSNPFEQF